MYVIKLLTSKKIIKMKKEKKTFTVELIRMTSVLATIEAENEHDAIDILSNAEYPECVVEDIQYYGDGEGSTIGAIIYPTLEYDDVDECYTEFEYPLAEYCCYSFNKNDEWKAEYYDENIETVKKLI